MKRPIMTLAVCGLALAAGSARAQIVAIDNPIWLPDLTPVAEPPTWTIPIADPWWWGDLQCDHDPTYEECMSDERDPNDPHRGYWSSLCGIEERERWSTGEGGVCQWYYAPLFEEQGPAAIHRFDLPGFTFAPVYLPPEARKEPGRALVQSFRAPYDRSRHFVSGMTSVYAGRLQAAKVDRFRRYGANLLGDWGGRQQFAANGNEVASCEEYVYERYFDYSRFEDSLSVYPDRLLEFVRAAFAPGGMAYKLMNNQPLTSRSGGSSFQVTPFYDQYPRNIYHAFVQEMPFRGFIGTRVDYAPYPIPAEITDKIRSTPLVRHDLAFHQRMAASAPPAHISDFVDEKQAEFALLLQERQALIGYWHGALDEMRRMFDSCNRLDPGFQKWPQIAVNPNPLTDRSRVLELFSPGVAGVPQVAPTLSPTSYGAVLGYLQQQGTLAPAVANTPLQAHISGGLQAVELDLPASFLPALPETLPYPMSSSCDMYNARRNLDFAAEEVAKRLVDLDYRIARELIFARDELRCFDAGVTACDWSPRLFVRELSGLLRRERDEAYGQCKRMTADNFTATSLIKNAQANQISRLQNMAATTELVQEYFRDLDLKLSKIEFPVDPETKAPILGARAADKGSEGNDVFAVEYAYDVGWRLTDLDDGRKRVCAANIAADANFDASVTIFGEKAQVVTAINHAHTYEETSKRGIKGNFYLNVMGKQFYDEKPHLEMSTAPMTFTPGKKSVRRTIFDVKKTFMVGFVPVTIAAGAAGEAGVDLKLELALTRNCPDPYNLGIYDAPRNNLTADAKIAARPFAGLDAFASAAVDLLVASAGVRAELTLLRLELPLAVQLGIQLVTNTGQVKVKATGTLDLVLRALDGRLVAFVDTIFGSVVDETLFTWEGPSTRERLVTSNWDHNLIEASMALQRGARK